MADIFFHIKKQSYFKTKTEQIVEGVIETISCGDLEKGDALPSVNKFISRLEVSRVTVVRALDILKKMGVIVSEDKKGYFVNDGKPYREFKVFLFLGGFDSHHEVLYNSIMRQVEGHNVMVDVFFHHFNVRVFHSILKDNLGSYGLYLISTFDDPRIATDIARIPPTKLLQIVRTPYFPEFSFVGQDFSAGLFRALTALNELIAKYRRFVLIYPNSNCHSVFIIHIFAQYCTSVNIDFSIENTVVPEHVEAGTAYWVIEDSALLELIRVGEAKGLKLGTDYGILSYNETPMKEIIRKGITVVSVDFEAMGREIGQFVIDRKPVKKIFEPQVIVRKSL